MIMMKLLVFVSGAAVAGAQFFAPRSGEFGGSPFFGVAPAPPAPEAAGDLDDLEALLSLAAEACEQKLIDEIDTLRKKQQDPDDLPGYAELKEYRYLNGVLQEVLRLSGPAPLFARKCSKTV